MTQAAVVWDESVRFFTPRSYPRPQGLRLFLCRALNGVFASALATMVFCAAYLCKCKMGIDLFAGPSFLHDPLYWIVSAKS